MRENALIDTFRQGGPIMWPLLLTSLVAVGVVLERIIWWARERRNRRPKQEEKVYDSLAANDVEGALAIACNSSDPVLRMIWHGLNHVHASLQGALQVAAGIELERAGRFLSVLDTLVTLAPLLGLLGTVTGIMHSFKFVGDQQLAASKVSGGIAEALIATAYGLSIAIFALVPFNFFQRLLERLRFELETAATNVEVILQKNKAAK